MSLHIYIYVYSNSNANQIALQTIAYAVRDRVPLLFAIFSHDYDDFFFFFLLAVCASVLF